MPSNRRTDFAAFVLDLLDFMEKKIREAAEPRSASNRQFPPQGVVRVGRKQTGAPQQQLIQARLGCSPAPVAAPAQRRLAPVIVCPRSIPETPYFIGF
jgi:hypothetical protein